MPKLKGLSPRELSFVELLPNYDWKVWKAGVAAGFSENYSKHRLPGLVLSKVPLALAIRERKIETSNLAAAERIYTRSEALNEYDQVRVLALNPPKKKGAKLNLDAANTAIKGKARLFGLDLDHGQIDVYPGRRPDDGGPAVQASKDRLQTYRETQQLEQHTAKPVESIQVDPEGQNRANNSTDSNEQHAAETPEGGAGG